MTPLSSVDVGSQPEAVTRKAISIVHRVRDKLTGKDFMKSDDVTGADVSEQVQQLIKQSTAHENLCQCYIGWYVMGKKKTSIEFLSFYLHLKICDATSYCNKIAYRQFM